MQRVSEKVMFPVSSLADLQRDGITTLVSFFTAAWINSDHSSMSVSEIYLTMLGKR